LRTIFLQGKTEAIQGKVEAIYNVVL